MDRGVIVDAHHHVWDLAVRDQPWTHADALAPLRRSFAIDELAGQAAACGVAATVVVQTVPDPAETPELLTLAQGSDLVAGVVGWVDLAAVDVADRLAELRDGPGGQRLAGVRHLVQDEPDPDWLARPDVLRGLRAVRDAGLRYDLLTLPAQLPAVCAAVEAVPELQFVVDHMSKPAIAAGEWQPWADLMTRLAGQPNVACKLSGLVTEADWTSWSVESLRRYADHVIDVFGPRRLMFGSDWPACTVAATYGEWFAAAEELSACLSGDERAEVFSGTATRVYALVAPEVSRVRGAAGAPALPRA